jgi:hypothetical protein
MVRMVEVVVVKELDLGSVMPTPSFCYMVNGGAQLLLFHGTTFIIVISSHYKFSRCKLIIKDSTAPFNVEAKCKVQ